LVMTGALVVMLLVPLYFGITALVRNADRLEGWSRTVATMSIPGPPAWLDSLPLIGTKVATRWREFAADGPSAWAEQVSPYARTLVGWFVGQVGSMAFVLLQFVLTIVIAAILYSNGEQAV